MFVNVDWISISLPYSQFVSQSPAGSFFEFPSDVDVRGRALEDYLYMFDDIQAGKGRAPFNRSFFSRVGGFTVFTSDRFEFSLIEFTGTGCEVLREHNYLEEILKDFHDRITRIDVAVDIECDLDPAHFAAARSGKRFKSGAEMVSERGKTVYVGSRSSNRYARVYRYSTPHPRSHLLRVEMVAKDEDAKLAAQLIGAGQLSSVADAMGNIYGWHHPVWGQSGVDGKLISAPRETHQGNTEFWLYKQVLPACKRILENGSIDTLTDFTNQLILMINERLDNERL